LIDAAIWLFGGITAVCADLKTFITLRPIRYEKLHFGDIRQKHKEGTINTSIQQAVVENDDVCHLMIQFSNQGAGTIRASRLHSEQSIRIECYKGTFVWKFNTDQLVYRKPGEKDYTPVEIPDSYPDRSMVTNFLNNIREDTQESPTFHDGLRSQLVLDAAVQSDIEKRWIDLDC
jgi:predicted dehydrogenase